MWLKWLPWRLVVSQLARSHGFIDPMVLISSLNKFAQPSEVSEPVELLRAGVVFHARGLLNTKAIQHNLDWVWPYWVERQFDPRDQSFIPRGFSITHTNLTHRNWTAVGVPDCDQYSLVDPRGLVTPWFDSWSFDAWILADTGRHLFPSRAAAADQHLLLGPSLAVRTRISQPDGYLNQRVEMRLEKGRPCLRLQVAAMTEQSGWLVIGLRPVNPEGVSFIHQVAVEDGGRSWLVNNKKRFFLEPEPERFLLSSYAEGDVLAKLPAGPATDEISCPVGMATAAALYRLEPATPGQAQIRVEIDQGRKGKSRSSANGRIFPDWTTAMQTGCRLRVPDPVVQRLYDGALASLVLHSPGEVYPGPYTYKRFWFRDAAFILKGLLAANFKDRVARCLELYPRSQRLTGYFHSQNGEWDSNGEALWILEQFSRYTGRSLDEKLLRSVRKGARWICRKRVAQGGQAPHAGLMPAGFSAEHFGPNDYYYWDDFWSAAGLQAAGRLFEQIEPEKAAEWRQEADSLLAAVERSLDQTGSRRRLDGIPASPYRRIDAAAIGSLVASYPLQLWEAADPRVLATAEFLYDRCLVHGGFFQDMIHSGINAYLTLHLAQVFLRAGDQRFLPLLRQTAALASPTGQWPEAIHPLTGGGCMGDGQHIWAAAEWVLMVRNCLVREEGNRLILGSGLHPDWLTEGAMLEIGPTPTPWGDLEVSFTVGKGVVRVEWRSRWRQPPAGVEVRLPGRPVHPAAVEDSPIELAVSR